MYRTEQLVAELFMFSRWKVDNFSWEKKRIRRGRLEKKGCFFSFYDFVNEGGNLSWTSFFLKKAIILFKQKKIAG